MLFTTCSAVAVYGSPLILMIHWAPRDRNAWASVLLPLNRRDLFYNVYFTEQEIKLWDRDMLWYDYLLHVLPCKDIEMCRNFITTMK